MNGPWPQSEVLKEPRVQLKLGLNRTKGNTDLGADDAAAEYQSFMRCRSGKARWRTNTKLRREIVLLSGQNGNQNHRTGMVARLIQTILVCRPSIPGIGKLARRQATW